MTVALKHGDRISRETNLESLRAEGEQVALNIAQIETDLEFRDGDQDWLNRAKNALAINRYLSRVIARRLGELTPSKPVTEEPVRPADFIHPLTRIALQHARPPVPSEFGGLISTASIDAELEQVIEALNAVQADRTDEISLPARDRDVAFITQCNQAITALKARRVGLKERRSELLKAEKRATQVQTDRTDERAFVDVARDILPGATYRQIWDEVRRRRADSGAPV